MRLFRVRYACLGEDPLQRLVFADNPVLAAEVLADLCRVRRAAWRHGYISVYEHELPGPGELRGILNQIGAWAYHITPEGVTHEDR